MTKRPVTIYGIKNCDTMKKARAWLDEHGVAYAFHDYKSEGIDRDRLERWADAVGWETLLNRAGTTFRKLPDKDKASVVFFAGLKNCDRLPSRGSLDTSLSPHGEVQAWRWLRQVVARESG